MTVVLDTNVVLYHLSNRLTADLPDGPLCVSIITEIELLSYPELEPEEEVKLKGFLERVNVIELSQAIKNETINLRRLSQLKIPDAVIAATALVLNATLMTNDKQFAVVPNVRSMTPQLVD